MYLCSKQTALSLPRPVPGFRDRERGVEESPDTIGQHSG